MAVHNAGRLEVASALERLEPAAFQQVSAAVLDLCEFYFQVSSATDSALQVEQTGSQVCLGVVDFPG